MEDKVISHRDFIDVVRASSSNVDVNVNRIIQRMEFQKEVGFTERGIDLQIWIWIYATWIWEMLSISEYFEPIASISLDIGKWFSMRMWFWMSFPKRVELQIFMEFDYLTSRFPSFSLPQSSAPFSFSMMGQTFLNCIHDDDCTHWYRKIVFKWG